MAYSNNGTLATWTNLTNIMLNQRSHKRKITEHFHIQKVQVKAKKLKINIILLFIVTKVKIVTTCREWHMIKKGRKGHIIPHKIQNTQLNFISKQVIF